MSLENIKENASDENDIYNRENKSNILPLLNLIKINKSLDSNYSGNKTIDINNKNNLSSGKGNVLITNNAFLNYIKNIKSKKEKKHILNSRNLDNLLLKDESVSTNSPKRTNISEYISPRNIKINKNKKNYYNNPNYVKLNSLFSLPPIIKRKNPYNNNSITEINSNPNRQRFNSLNNNKKIVLNNINNKYMNNKSFSIKDKEENEDHKYDNINSFMKFKYYEDVNEKFEKKLRDDSFIDRGIKDKIIKIGKVGIFWRNVFEYCGSFIFAEKFKNIKKQFRKKYLKQQEEEFNINKYSKTPNKKLYTNLLVNKRIHYQNRNKINE